MAALFGQMKFDEIITCFNGNHDEIKKAEKKISTLMKKAHVTPDLRVLVYMYYSGHGVM